MITNQYQKQADDMLAEMGVTFSVTLIGSDCPKFCDDARVNREMDKVNVYPRKSHIHGKHYRATFTRAKDPIGSEGKYELGKWRTGILTVDFWNSYADEEENYFAFDSSAPLNNWITGRDNRYWDKYCIDEKYPRGPRATKRIVPTAYDVLSCMEKSEPGTFQDFCGDFGYDTDSQRAEETYHAVQDEYRRMVGFFSVDEMARLQEIQ